MPKDGTRISGGSTGRRRKRRSLMRRDGAICQHCYVTEEALQAVGQTLTIDHKRPFSRGGTSSLENLQLLCPDCNQRKADTM